MSTAYVVVRSAACYGAHDEFAGRRLTVISKHPSYESAAAAIPCTDCAGDVDYYVSFLECPWKRVHFSTGLEGTYDCVPD